MKVELRQMFVGGLVGYNAELAKDTRTEDRSGSGLLQDASAALSEIAINRPHFLNGRLAKWFDEHVAKFYENIAHPSVMNSRVNAI